VNENESKLKNVLDGFGKVVQGTMSVFTTISKDQYEEYKKQAKLTRSEQNNVKKYEKKHREELEKIVIQKEELELKSLKKIKNRSEDEENQFKKLMDNQAKRDKEKEKNDKANDKADKLREKEKQIEEGKKVVNSVKETAKKMVPGFDALMGIVSALVGLKIFSALLNSAIGGGWLESLVDVLNVFGDISKIWDDSELSTAEKWMATFGELKSAIGNLFLVTLPFLVLAFGKSLLKKGINSALGKIGSFSLGIKQRFADIKKRFENDGSKKIMKDGFNDLKKSTKNRMGTLKRNTKLYFDSLNPRTASRRRRGRGGPLDLSDAFDLGPRTRKVVGKKKGLLGVGKNILGGGLKALKGGGKALLAPLKMGGKLLKGVPVVGQIIMAIEGLIGGFTAAFSIFEESGDIGESIFGGIGGAIDGMFGWIKDIIAWFAGVFGFEETEKMLDDFSFTELFRDMWKAIKNWFSGAKDDAPEESWWSLLWGKITSLFDKIGQKIREFKFGDLVDIFSGAGEIEGIAKGLAANVMTDKGATKELKEKARGVVTKIESKHRGGFVDEVPAMLQSGEYVVSRQDVTAAMYNGGRVSALDTLGAGTGGMSSPPIINNIVNNNSNSNVSNIGNTVAQPFSNLYGAFTG
jgi:hypothetical protein